MAETLITQVVGQVMVYDSAAKQWHPAGTSSGLSTVRLIHCANNIFRIHGQKINENKEVVLDSQITREVKFNQPNEAFVQWHDSQAFWGLNFRRGTNDVDKFFKSVLQVLQILNQNGLTQQQPPAQPSPQQQQQQQQQTPQIVNHHQQQQQQAPQTQIINHQPVVVAPAAAAVAQTQMLGQIRAAQMMQQQANQQQMLQQHYMQQQRPPTQPQNHNQINHYQAQPQQIPPQQHQPQQMQPSSQQQQQQQAHLQQHQMQQQIQQQQQMQQQMVQQQQMQQQIQQQQQQQQQVAQAATAPIPPPPPPPPPPAPPMLNNPVTNGVSNNNNINNNSNNSHSFDNNGGGGSPNQASSLANELAKCQLKKVNLSRSDSDRDSECNNTRNTRAASLACVSNKLMSEMSQILASRREKIDQDGDGQTNNNNKKESNGNSSNTNGLDGSTGGDKVPEWLVPFIKKEISMALGKEFAKMKIEIMDLLKTELRRR